MKRLLLILTVACLALGAAPDPAPRRVISLIPAATEMIFAMGAGSRLIAVSSYDTFPPEATKLPKVGALLDPDTERILAMRPDLVILYGTQIELRRSLDRASVAYYTYEHRAMPDIMATIRSIGARIGDTAQANALATSMEQALAGVRATVAGRRRPRTMLVFERDRSSLQNIYASGGYGFLADLLDAAGGDNVFSDLKQQSVQASTEMILARRPDVIIELRYGQSAKDSNPARDLRPWDALGSVPAVKAKQIHLLIGDQYVVPGPRIVDAARQLGRVLHPDARW
jgi:ABC-type Fe3+-hydroxamate transport system substrate-binding protein